MNAALVENARHAFRERFNTSPGRGKQPCPACTRRTFKVTCDTTGTPLNHPTGRCFRPACHYTIWFNGTRWLEAGTGTSDTYRDDTIEWLTDTITALVEHNLPGRIHPAQPRTATGAQRRASTQRCIPAARIAATVATITARHGTTGLHISENAHREHTLASRSTITVGLDELVDIGAIRWLPRDDDDTVTPFELCTPKLSDRSRAKKVPTGGNPIDPECVRKVLTCCFNGPGLTNTATEGWLIALLHGPDTATGYAAKLGADPTDTAVNKHLRRRLTAAADAGLVTATTTPSTGGRPSHMYTACDVTATVTELSDPVEARRQQVHADITARRARQRSHRTLMSIIHHIGANPDEFEPPRPSQLAALTATDRARLAAYVDVLPAATRLTLRPWTADHDPATARIGELHDCITGRVPYFEHIHGRWSNDLDPAEAHRLVNLWHGPNPTGELSKHPTPRQLGRPIRLRDRNHPLVRALFARARSHIPPRPLLTLAVDNTARPWRNTGIDDGALTWLHTVTGEIRRIRIPTATPA